MFGILGSGFGLYGYLPALIEGSSQQILLPERYRSRFNERKELAKYNSCVHWAADEGSMLGQVDGVVIALRPVDQSRWIELCFQYPNIKYLLLEKPIAQDPASAKNLLAGLVKSGKVFRIGYTFRYTNWYKQLLAFLQAEGKIGVLQIKWNLLAHHYRHDLINWKRFNSMGGGALRFYGIHLIALMAEAGYTKVISSKAFYAQPDECEQWLAGFSGSGLPKCDFLVDSRSTNNEFQVTIIPDRQAQSRQILVADLQDPFETTGAKMQLDGIDRRVQVLRHLCRSLWDNQANINKWCYDTVSLWEQVEAITQWYPSEELDSHLNSETL